MPLIGIGISYLGDNYFIFLRYTDPQTQFFRVDEKKYNDFSHLCRLFFENFMSDDKDFSIYNESGSKHVLKLPSLKHFND